MQPLHSMHIHLFFQNWPLNQNHPLWRQSIKAKVKREGNKVQQTVLGEEGRGEDQGWKILRASLSLLCSDCTVINLRIIERCFSNTKLSWQPKPSTSQDSMLPDSSANLPLAGTAFKFTQASFHQASGYRKSFPKLRSKLKIIMTALHLISEQLNQLPPICLFACTPAQLLSTT